MLLLVLIALIGFGAPGGSGGAGGAPPAGVEPAPPVAAAPREPEVQVPTGRFTTAVEVRPILDATRPSWVAVREFDGRDLLYFTGLLAWRCGLWEVRYGLNGAPPEIPVPLEACHEDTAQPNALIETEIVPPYVEAPLGSIESVEVEILFDDGTEDAAVYARASILMP